MGLASWQYAALGAAAVASIFAIGAYFYLKVQGEDCEWIDWNDYDTNIEPPAPIFGCGDVNSCKEGVTTYYDWAASSYRGSVENDAKLDASYNSILSKQKQYGKNLANNASFRSWVLSDWSQSWYY